MNFSRNTHGGRRTGAGRKRQVDEGSHAKRPALHRRHPLHVTVRLRTDLPGLRDDDTMKLLQTAMGHAQKFGLRVNHFSLLSNHLHMIVEADGLAALQRGMMSFNSRLGRWLRAQKARPQDARRGFFKGRYHARAITSARQMKNTLRYVLLNASKHFRKCPHIDVFSSGAGFTKWRELLREDLGGLLQAQVLSLESAMGGSAAYLSQALPEGLSPPKTWLGTRGWR